MSLLTSTLLVDRGVLRVSGEDACSFLQGLVSNDVLRVASDRAIWAAFLTAQGRYLHDFFLSQLNGGLILERRIRSAAGPETPVIDVQTALAGRPRRTGPSFGVWALIGDGAASAIGLRTEEPGAALPVNGGVVFVDPRTAAGGLRAVLPRDEGERPLQTMDLRAVILLIITGCASRMDCRTAVATCL